MPFRLTESEIDELVVLYRLAIEKVVKTFSAAIDFGSWKVEAGLASVRGIFKTLREKTRAWADRRIRGLYRSRRKEVLVALRERGLRISHSAADRVKWESIHRRAVEEIIDNAESGLVPKLDRAAKEVERRVFDVSRKAKLIRSQQGLVDSIIGSDSFARGLPPNEVKDRIVREILSNRATEDLVWSNRISRSAPVDSILENLANLPSVKIPHRTAAKGYRRLRLDYYAEILARTKGRQAAVLATRNEMLEHGQSLVQVSINAPLQDDACWLYVARVFSLTREEADKWGVAMVDELPNGGAPFHPNCTHFEIPYFPEQRSEEERRAVLTKPPAWALRRPFTEVEREWKKRGGLDALPKLNPAGQTYGESKGGRKRWQAEQRRKTERGPRPRKSKARA